MKGDGSVSVRTEGEEKGGETEKPEKEKETERDCHFNPSSAGVYSPACELPGRTSEGGSTLSTAHRGDQAQKPASCTFSVGP